MPIEMPPLDVPAPPPRLVEPSASEEPPPGPVLAEPAILPTPPSAETTAPPPASTPTPAEPKPAPAQPVGNAPRTQPPTTLQTVPTQEGGKIERSIIALIRRAVDDLNRVNYQALGSVAKANYDQAKRFIAQAQEALKAKNLVFAETVADKAATLAGGLAGR